MSFFKSIKQVMLLVNIVYIVIGCLLLLKGSACVEFVVTVLGFVLMACGLIEIIRYFVTKIDDRFKRNDFILGVTLMALAIVVIICRYSLSDIAIVALGIAIIVSGALKFQDAIDAKRMGDNHFTTYLICLIICIAFGTLVIFNYFYSFSVAILYSSAGIGLIFAGVTDLISTIYLAALKAKYEKGKDNPVEEDDNQESETTEDKTEGKFTTIDIDVPKETNIDNNLPNDDDKKDI